MVRDVIGVANWDISSSPSLISSVIALLLSELSPYEVVDHDGRPALGLVSASAEQLCS